MKIKITKCSNPNYWYSDKIGEEFEVLLEATDVYNVDAGGNKAYYWAVMKSDCEIVEEKSKYFPTPTFTDEELEVIRNLIYEAESKYHDNPSDCRKEKNIAAKITKYFVDNAPTGIDMSEPKKSIVNFQLDGGTIPASNNYTLRCVANHYTKSDFDALVANEKKINVNLVDLKKLDETGQFDFGILPCGCKGMWVCSSCEDFKRVVSKFGNTTGKNNKVVTTSSDTDNVSSVTSTELEHLKGLSKSLTLLDCFESKTTGGYDVVLEKEEGSFITGKVGGRDWMWEKDGKTLYGLGAHFDLILKDR